MALICTDFSYDGFEVLDPEKERKTWTELFKDKVNETLAPNIFKENIASLPCRNVILYFVILD